MASNTTDIGVKERVNHIVSVNQLKMTIGLAFDTVGVVVSVLLIFKYSTPLMKTYKYHLINLIAWSYALDFVMTLLWMPIPVMPVPGLCSVGFIRYVRVILNNNWLGHAACFLAFLFLLNGVGCAYNTANFQRFQDFGKMNNTSVNKKTFFIGSYALPIACFLPMYLTFNISMNIDVPRMLKYVETQFPDAGEVAYMIKAGIPCGVFQFSGPMATIFLAVALSAVLFHTLFGVTFCLIAMKKLSEMMTSNHKDLQTEIFYVIFVQGLLPLACLVIPYTLLVVEIMIDNEALAGVTNALMTLGSLHTFLHTIVIISICKPYRDAVLKIVFGRKPIKRGPHTAVISLK